MRLNFLLVEAAGEAFARRLRPDDKARIGSFAAHVQVDPQDFTSDQEEMVRILREAARGPAATLDGTARPNETSGSDAARVRQNPVRPFLARWSVHECLLGEGELAPAWTRRGTESTTDFSLGD